MVQIVREKGIFHISNVFRLVLSTRREEISTAFTRSPRLDSVEFSKGCRKQRVLFHLVEEARIPEKVLGGKRRKCAIPSRDCAAKTNDGGNAALHLRTRCKNWGVGCVGVESGAEWTRLVCRGAFGRKSGTRTGPGLLVKVPTVGVFRRVRFTTIILQYTGSAETLPYEPGCQMSRATTINLEMTQERRTQCMPLSHDH
jgi:hypothetical protein